MLNFNLFVLIIYFIQLAYYYARIIPGGTYTEVCSKSRNENETSLYRKRDFEKDLSSYDMYTHIFKLLLKKNKFNSNKKAIVEYECGKPKHFFTYDALFSRIIGFSHSLNNFEGGVPVKKYDEEQNGGAFRILGIYGNNSANWIVADLASMLSGVTTLIMHSKFSFDEIVEILRESRLEWLCTDLNLVDKLLSRRNDLPDIKYLIILDHFGKPNNSNNVFEGNNEEEEDNENICENEKEKLNKLNQLKEEAKNFGIKIVEFEVLVDNNEGTDIIQNESENFITSIVYTSGTSGRPKGVMLSNENFYYTLTSLYDSNLFSFNLLKHLSYLPLSHIYERINVHLALLKGLEVHVWSKEIHYFVKDLLEAKSNFLTGVPKVFSKLYANIMTEIEKLSKVKRFFVEKILQLRRYNNNGKFGKFLESITHISKKIRRRINPNLTFMINGGGRLSSKIEKELHILLDAKIYQGYGLTETTGPLFLQNKDDMHYSTVGGPISSSTVFKLVTWESYNVNDKLPKGELLVKSKQLFCGYFLRKEQTKNAFTEDNFYKTGDVVQINDNGSISFLDRSKELVKLSQGEYIETGLLNNLYSEISFINHCVVYGDEDLDGPIAIVSIDKNLFSKSLLEDNILSDQKISEEEFLDLVDDDMINADIYVNYVKDKMLETYNKTNLNRYNIINTIYLTVKIWDTNNYLTPTFKVRRFNVFKDYSFFIEKAKEYHFNSKVENLKVKNKLK
ncbi:acyl-CoA synthetase, putative [Plasmodium gallinaceum]|uniref:Acyl-CoA synthetase, putative n=1 Tax=Plasmodium gallinaceum TaxID=5849 RepID=A0A1J1GPC8_PLAGA|nr:acyl-CoA synthetase, putative [Plasmodium gallinaceum]CRG94353.1 acyl-CoA synthetase, putative [Plasmodium gallinaceum]